MNNYPSVTEILSIYQDFSKIPEHRLEEGIRRGNLVHTACAGYAKGIWVPCKDYSGYVKSFMQWFDTMIVDVLYVEERFTDEINGYTGQPDLIVMLKGDEYPAIVDNKTPVSFKKIWAGQMAGYLNLIRKNGISARRAITIRLKKDGSMPLVDSYNEQTRDLQAFLNACWAYKYFMPERI